MKPQAANPWVLVQGRSALLPSIARVRRGAFPGGAEARSLPGAPAVLDERDSLAASTHCLVFHGDDPVAGARLQVPDGALAAAQGTSFGFGLEADVELSGLGPTGTFAEVARVCALPGIHRTTEALPRLVAALVAASELLGVRHWLAAASCETADATEAETLYRLAGRLGRIHPTVRATSRAAQRAAAGDRSLPPRGLRGPVTALSPRPEALPPELAMYLTKLGAKAIGRPVRCSDLGTFVIPIAVSLDELTSGNSAYSRRLRRLAAPTFHHDYAGAPRSAA